MIVDADGGVWVAVWGGAQVRRYTPDGRLERSIAVPATYPTKPAFGGRDLADLYITSARGPMPAEALAREPLAGGVFVCRPGVTGKPATPFAG